MLVWNLSNISKTKTSKVTLKILGDNSMSKEEDDSADESDEEAVVGVWISVLFSILISLYFSWQKLLKMDLFLYGQIKMLDHSMRILSLLGRLFLLHYSRMKLMGQRDVPDTILQSFSKNLTINNLFRTRKDDSGMASCIDDVDVEMEGGDEEEEMDKSGKSDDYESE